MCPQVEKEGGGEGLESRVYALIGLAVFWFASFNSVKSIRMSVLEKKGEQRREERKKRTGEEKRREEREKEKEPWYFHSFVKQQQQQRVQLEAQYR